MKKEFQIPRQNRISSRMNFFDILNYFLLILFAFITIYPIYYIFIGSFNQGLDYNYGGVNFITRVFSFENYIVIFHDERLYSAYLVTISRVIIGTIVSLFFTSMVAYAMSSNNLKGKKIFYLLNLIAMFFSGGLIPYFLVIKYLGLFDSFLVYIIPNMYSVFNMIILSNFFKKIPKEIRESALIDGASEFRIWFQLIIPLSLPALATIALWVSLIHWNSYFDSMIFINNPNLHTLQYYLLKIIKETSLPSTNGVPLPSEVLESISPMTVQLAAIVVAIVPIMFIYPFLSKYFNKGISVGSLKE